MTPRFWRTNGRILIDVDEFVENFNKMRGIDMAESRLLRRLEEEGCKVIFKNSQEIRNAVVKVAESYLDQDTKEVNFCCAIVDNRDTRTYKRGAKDTYNLREVDCSLFTQHVFGTVGIYLPRLSVEQFLFAQEFHNRGLQSGDVIFTSGRINYHTMREVSGNRIPVKIGHVGIVVHDGGSKFRIIHAVNKNPPVVAECLEEFEARHDWFLYKYVVPDNACVIEVPEKFENDVNLFWRLY